MRQAVRCALHAAARSGHAGLTDHQRQELPDARAHLRAARGGGLRCMNGDGALSPTLGLREDVADDSSSEPVAT
jgi:hypothetical protein